MRTTHGHPVTIVGVYCCFGSHCRQQLIFDMSLKTSNFQSCPSGVDASSRPKESLGVFLRRLLHRKILASLGEDAGGDAESSENEDGM